MAKRPGIFPTFFISGFECSTFLWRDKKRRNLIADTQHDRFAMATGGSKRTIQFLQHRSHDTGNEEATNTSDLGFVSLWMTWIHFQKHMMNALPAIAKRLLNM